MQRKTKDILIVGSVAFDSVQTPFGSVERGLGGSASYAALAAAYFSSPQMVAIVGEDFQDEHYELFRNQGIDTSGIVRAPGKTFHWRGIYHENLQDRDTLETCLNVFEGFDPELPENFRHSPHVFLGNIDPKLQAKVLDQVEGARFVGMDTMNYWISKDRASLTAVLERADIVFINDEEAFQLSGEKQVLNAAENILELGPKYVVIKRGEFGSLLFGPDVCLFVPAVLLPRVVDPTGAGDAFAGGFLGTICDAGGVTRPALARAMISGTVMASFAVEKFSVNGLLELQRGSIDIRRGVLEEMTNYK